MLKSDQQGNCCCSFHTSLLFHKLETLKLFDIHSLQLLCFVFDCTKEQPLSHLQNFFVPVHSVHKHFTRQVAKQNIYVQNVHTTQCGIRSARYFGTTFLCALKRLLLKIYLNRNYKNGILGHISMLKSDQQGNCCCSFQFLIIFILVL